MKEQKLLDRLEELEFEQEELLAEMEEVDYLLRAIGFPEGLRSIREVAHEFILDESEEID